MERHKRLHTIAKIFEELFFLFHCLYKYIFSKELFPFSLTVYVIIDLIGQLSREVIGSTVSRSK